MKIYARLPLSQKIILPFLIVFVSVLIVGVMIIGSWFTQSLETNIQEDMKVATPWVSREFGEQIDLLLMENRKLSNLATLKTALQTGNYNWIYEQVAPLKEELELDWLKILDAQNRIIIDLRSEPIEFSKIDHKIDINHGINELPLSDLVNIKDLSLGLIITTSLIKSDNGVLGAIVLGRLVTPELLEVFKEGMNIDLVAWNSEFKMIASTLPGVTQVNWEPPKINQSPKNIMIKNQSYLAKTVGLGGKNQNALLITILYSTTTLEEGKKLLWIELLQLLFASVLVVTITGFLIARAISHSLKNFIHVTQKLAAQDLTVRVPINSSDELGKVGIAFNKMAEQLAEREYLLQDQLDQLSQALSELKRTQSQLIQSEKMSSLGQLVAGVAHEINNPVSFIYGNIEYVKQYTTDLLKLIRIYQEVYPDHPQEIVKVLEDIDLDFIIKDLPNLVKSIQSGADRIHKIVLSLRNFSRLDESELKTVDIHEGIENSLILLNHRFNSKMEVIKNYSNLPKIECYVASLNQVFMAILTNAIDAIEEANIDNSKNPRIIINTEMNDSDHIRIRIRDNGHGIPDHIQERIFDPFFTTKPIGKGTGLSLAIAYQIIQKHQAEIQVHSSENKGTEFIIILPIKYTPTDIISPFKFSNP
ncbi:sensor histidine kinase [Planktothrix paucivesiculata]|uniref:histidine kinase n=1 Tax=Planktothrix paucivesiculata PCC 9631 TaxID=671071 RepID=A0A7Z9DYV2_9CYAN|nr:ATP-binding protein [Planktothrix paucivesiculata]VXD13979.1 putative Sensor protein [Planktothrix paucivesiculata PCC 9631]